ncbi:TraM recognition domain-containing protein [Bifidobacterium breve]|uniref:TraM recognition domain-containing protein n=1 Tax=Bifidobacterium breve TaxID=1685 RepID=UPI001D149CD2
MVYLELPDTNATFGFLAACSTNALRDPGQESRPHGRRPARPRRALPARRVRQHRQNPNFVRLIATIRSRGISCSIICKPFPKQKLYRDDWETIAGNCDSWLFSAATKPPPPNHQRPARRPNHRRHRNQRTKGANGSWSRSVRKNARKLLTPTNSAASTPANASTCYEAYRPSQPQTDGLGRRTIHMRTVGKCINESNLIGYPLTVVREAQRFINMHERLLSDTSVVGQSERCHVD